MTDKKDFIYSLARDRDHPRRVFSSSRVARLCRQCGSRFLAKGPLERVCSSCQSYRLGTQAKGRNKPSSNREA